MKQFVVRVCALLLFVALSLPSAGAAPSASQLDIGRSAAMPADFFLPAHHRCVPSRCGCRGSQKTWCYHDCRRDRHCHCVAGRYVCHFFHHKKYRR